MVCHNQALNVFKFEAELLLNFYFKIENFIFNFIKVIETNIIIIVSPSLQVIDARSIWAGYSYQIIFIEKY